MRNCDSCGESYSNTGSQMCGCTWDEQIMAARIKERRRRDALKRDGRPVIVDDLGPMDDILSQRIFGDRA